MAITNYDGSLSTATPNYSSMVANFGKKQPKLDVYGRPLKQVDLSFLGNKTSAMPQAVKPATLNSGTTPKSYTKPVVATAFGGGSGAVGIYQNPNNSMSMEQSLYPQSNESAMLGGNFNIGSSVAPVVEAPVSAMTEFASAPSGNSLGIGGSYTNDAGNTVYGSVGDRVSDYTSGLNSDGFWSHNVGNMPEGLSDVEKAAWLQSPSTFSNILGGVGTGASALSSLYGMYMQNKNYNLQKDAYNKQVAMARASEGRMSDFAKAMGGSYRTANI